MTEWIKSGAKKPFKILLVEDSDGEARLFESALARLDGEFRLVSRVRDGQSAIAYLKGQGEFADRDRFPFPNIVMLELNLPGSDGFDLLAWAQRRNPRPVIAVFSNCESETDRRRAEQLGADLFQSKAYDATTFQRFLHFCGNIAGVRDGNAS